MGCRMHLLWHVRAIGLGTCLLLGAAACGPEISTLTAEAEATAAAANAPAAPVLLAPPSTEPASAPPGGTVLVTVQATSQRPLNTVTVSLHDGQGGLAGEAWLTPLDAETWNGGLTVRADASPGSYVLEVTLHDGPYVVGGRLLQTLYRFEPLASGTHYRTYANAIEVVPDAFVVDPLPKSPAGLPLVTVEIP